MVASNKGKYHLRLLQVRLLYSFERHTTEHVYVYGDNWRKAIEDHFGGAADLVAIAVTGKGVYYLGHGWCVSWGETCPLLDYKQLQRYTGRTSNG